MAWLSAAEALTRLQVQPQTLYAYVSRGRIQTKPDPAYPRRSLYLAQDVLRLADRPRGGRRPEAVAAEAMAWGEPVLPSAVSTVREGRLYYRGRDAGALADTAALEDVAALLWDAPEGERLFPADRPKPLWLPALAPAARAFAALARRAGTDATTLGRSPAVLRAEAAGLLGSMTDVLAGPPDAAERPVHRRLALAWGADERGGELIRRALVLLADHELNASTFAARVAASTGASLAASMLAGLAALSGPLHGGAAEQLRALADRAEIMGGEAAARAWLAQGWPLPGFGQPLYPEGDVRAENLLAAFEPSGPLRDLAAAGEALTGEKPNIDFALTALAEAAGLPPDAPFVLFAAARSAGWLAHALEQASTGRLIRPRARYVGPPVETVGA